MFVNQEPIKEICLNYYHSSVNSFIKDFKLGGFTIFQLNTGGIGKPNKYDKIKMLLSRLKFKSDIILLGETKLKSSFPSNIYHLNGYTQISCCRVAKNGGGGILLFIKKDMVTYDLAKSSSSFEKISFKSKKDGSEYKFVCYYRQPLNTSVAPFIDDLEQEIQVECKTIILGDVNFDANSDNAESRRYMSLIKSYDFEIVNNFKTRKASNRIIDHLGMNFKNELSIITHTVENSISDHNFIMTQLMNLKPVKQKRMIEIKSTDYSRLKQIFIAQINVLDIMQEKDPNNIAEKIVETTRKAVENSTCIRKITLKDSPLCHWYNQKIAQAIKYKDNVARKYRVNKKNVRWKLKLLVASKRLKMIIKSEKSKYIDKAIDTGDSKQIWNGINEILGRKNKNQGKCAVFNKENELIEDEYSVSQIFNNHFIESVKNLTSSIPSNSQPIESSTYEKTFALEHTCLEEVLLTIKSLENTSPGVDNIHTKIIKLVSSELSHPLCHLINTIFESGIFPKCFKSAVVIPLNKSNDKTNVLDYRPVSMLTIFNKIVEKILVKRLQNFTFNYAKLIYSHQYGFRPKCNTEIAAIELVQFIQEAVDRKKKVSMVSMDLSKAFDIVEVPRLLDCLYNNGIRGKAHDLLTSYLTNRCQQVKIGQHLSEVKQFTQGVVQGSVLGPWLFLMYFNSISKLKLTGKLYLYADDCVLVNVHEIQEPIEDKICKDMKVIINYLNHQRLILNVSKTNFILFHSAHARLNVEDKITVELDENEKYIISRVRKVRYLGLIMDELLKWDDHIEYLQSKIASIAGVLWKLKRQLPTIVKKRIYSSLLESHIKYMIPIWGSASDTAIKSLQVSQNRALRNIYDIDRLASRVQMYTYQVEDFLPIRALYFINTTALVYQCIHANIHTNLVFTAVDNEITRSDSYIRPLRSRTTYAARSFLSIGARMFNDVPKIIQESQHVHAFKFSLRNSVRNEDFMAICLSHQFLEKYS
jgi:hypothetical protein